MFVIIKREIEDIFALAADARSVVLGYTMCDGIEPPLRIPGSLACDPPAMALPIFTQLAFQAHTEGPSRTLHLDDAHGGCRSIAIALTFAKRGSDPSGQSLALLNCFGALRAATEVVFHWLPFVAREPVKDVIVKRFFCQVLKGEIRPAFLPSNF